MLTIQYHAEANQYNNNIITITSLINCKAEGPASINFRGNCQADSCLCRGDGVKTSPRAAAAPAGGGGAVPPLHLSPKPQQALLVAKSTKAAVSFNNHRWFQTRCRRACFIYTTSREQPAPSGEMGWGPAKYHLWPAAVGHIW